MLFRWARYTADQSCMDCNPTIPYRVCSVFLEAGLGISKASYICDEGILFIGKIRGLKWISILQFVNVLYRVGQVVVHHHPICI